MNHPSIPDLASVYALAQGGSGFSQEEQGIKRAGDRIADQIRSSTALYGPKKTVISQLMTMAKDCAEQGWDGCDACAISSRALQNAIDFVRALPFDFPMPECAPEPDGAISLDWIADRHRLFSLSIGDGDRLAYAWLDGTNRGHGVERFNGKSIPERIQAEIRSTTGGPHASIWIARTRR